MCQTLSFSPGGQKLKLLQTSQRLKANIRCIVWMWSGIRIPGSFNWLTFCVGCNSVRCIPQQEQRLIFEFCIYLFILTSGGPTHILCRFHFWQVSSFVDLTAEYPKLYIWCFSLRCFLKINLQLVGFWSYLLGKLSLPRKPRTSSEDACWAVVTFPLYFIADQISSVFNYLNSTLTFTCWSLFLENTKKSSRQQILNDSYSVLTLFFSSVFFSNPSSPSPHLFLTCFRWACGGQRK